MSDSVLPPESESLQLNDELAVERALSKLVDDELTAQQERQLLLHLEQQPQHWRDCALAFVTDRALQRGARGWLRKQDEAAPVEAAISTAPVADLTLAPRPSTVRTTRTWWHWSSLATAICASLVLGLVIRDYWPKNLDTPQNNPGNSSLMATTPTTPAVEKIIPDALPREVRMQFVNHNNEPGETVDVPLVPVSHVDQRMLQSWQQSTDLNLPTPFLKQLEQEGQVVRQQNSWMTITLPNGQQALVPIQRLQIVPRHTLSQ